MKQNEVRQGSDSSEPAASFWKDLNPDSETA